MNKTRRILTLSAMLAAPALAVHCGAGADAEGGIGGSAVAVSSGGAGAGGRERWDAGPNGAWQDIDGGITPNAGLGDGAAPPDVDAGLCPGLAHDDLVVSFALPHARATVSPTQARGVLLGDTHTPGAAPPGALVLADEFLSYYHVAYPKSAALSAVVDFEPGPLPSVDLVFQVGVQAPDPGPRAPTSITAVVDTSISMTGDAIARAQAAAAALLAALGPTDQFNLVTSNTDLPAQRFDLSDPSAVAAAQKAVAALVVDGGDDLGGAVVMGYQVANATLHGLDRVVLITDGGVPVSAIDLGLVSANADKPGINLIGVGVAPARLYDDTLLANASQAGRGADVYLDSADEAKARLTDHFDEVMSVAAYDVQITVTLPWYYAVQRAAGDAGADAAASGTDGSGGLAQTDLPAGRAMIFRQTIRACSPQVMSPNDFVAVDVSYAQSPGGTPSHLLIGPLAIGHPGATTSPPMLKGNLVAAFSDALATGDPQRATLAAGLAADPGFADDTEVTAPVTGIRALLAAQQGFVGQ